MEATSLQILLLILGVITSALATVIITMVNNIRSDVKNIWKTISENQRALHTLELEVSTRYVRREDLSAIIEGIVKGLNRG